MKNGILKLLLMVNVLFLPVIAYGQEQTEADEAQTSETTTTDGEEATKKSRPLMPKLFFSTEQRRILEVLRQEVIPQESIEFEEFVPLVFAQERVDNIIIEEELVREDDIVFDAFLRNRKTGVTSLWVNGEKHDLTDESGFLGREGLTELAVDLETNGAITGVDNISKSRFVLKVGQQLVGDGEIDETYPVVIIKRK